MKSGEIPLEKVPYMQRRGGRWDQSDVKGARRRQWSKYDKAYENGGRTRDQSVSIFGGASMPWTTQDLKGMSKGPDAEMVRQWKRMGVKGVQQPEPVPGSRKTSPSLRPPPVVAMSSRQERQPGI